MRRATLCGLVAAVLLLTGCSQGSVTNPPPQSVLQVAVQVAQGQATLEDLSDVAAGSQASSSQTSDALCAIDQNGDLLIDDAEILAAVEAWVNGTVIDGRYIGDSTILDAVSLWVEKN